MICMMNMLDGPSTIRTHTNRIGSPPHDFMNIPTRMARMSRTISEIFTSFGHIAGEPRMLWTSMGFGITIMRAITIAAFTSLKWLATSHALHCPVFSTPLEIAHSRTE